MKKILLLLAMAFICIHSSFAQCIMFQDSSFEGPQVVGAPPDWDTCSTVYTITNEYSFPAYAGNSYLGLGYSNFGGDSICDAVSQKLIEPLAGNGAPYTGTVALCSVNYQTIASSGLVCQICGGFDSCSPMEALWTSPVIQDSPTIVNATPYVPYWTLYTFTCNPHSAYTYIIIRVTAANYTGSVGHGGLIGVDTLGMCAVTTGIQTINSTTVSLYPNPATNQVTVNTGSSMPYALTVFDLTGREIITKEMAGTGTIDVSGLSKDCYLAKVIQGDKSYTQKLIIQ
jgi:hypothetical protein